MYSEDIQRLAKIGLCVSPGSVQNKLASWIDKLDEEIICLREEWAKGGQVKYQLVGDNWDKNIIPAFRTSQQKTLSLHLFNVVVVVDRIIPTFTRIGNEEDWKTDVPGDKEIFIPSIEEQSILMDELVFLFATSVIQNVPLDESRIFEHLSSTSSSSIYSTSRRKKPNRIR